MNIMCFKSVLFYIAYHCCPKSSETRRKLKNTFIFLRQQKRVLCINNTLTRKREKLRRGEKLRVYFEAYERTQWIFQGIYDAMDADPVFEPCVYVRRAWERTNQELATQDLIQFFEQQHMRVVREDDEQQLPDILFVATLSQAYTDFPPERFAHEILYCYTPYCWVLELCDGHTYGRLERFHRVYVHTLRDYEVCKREFMYLRGRAVLSGNPKNDQSYAARKKSTRNNNERLKIIYAPHWSLYPGGNSTSTFDKYYETVLDYVKQHPEIDFVIKPHPFLRKYLSDKDWQALHQVTDGLMPVEAYDDFMREWSRLPHCSVWDLEDYNDLFASSDGMILDSVSFLAEYTLFDKPMCFLSKYPDIGSLKNIMTEVGQDILDTLTIAYTWEDATHFIERLAAGMDNFAQLRHEVVRKHLDTNDGAVGQFITEELRNSI